MPLSDYYTHYALFFDDIGLFVGVKKLNPQDQTFTYLHNGYFFRPHQASTFTRPGSFTYNKFYMYFLGNPEPIMLKKPYTSVLTAQEVGVYLETDLLKKLNDLSNKNWLADLLKNPMFWVSIAVIGIVVWWISSHGGKLW